MSSNQLVKGIELNIILLKEYPIKCLKEILIENGMIEKDLEGLDKLKNSELDKYRITISLEDTKNDWEKIRKLVTNTYLEFNIKMNI